MKIAGIVKESFVDGEGIRFAVFLQGCPHQCVGCHNPETWDVDNGVEMSVNEVVGNIETHSAEFFKGITLSGGEPFLQQEACIELIRAVKSRWWHWDVWCYTGYTYENIKNEPLLKYIDVLVDGPFDISRKDMCCRFRGSNNQRILHLRDGEIWKVE
jgi:anaerobic ribonucleoside-triphosphate reductase activating protein